MTWQPPPPPAPRRGSPWAIAVPIVGIPAIAIGLILLGNRPPDYESTLVYHRGHAEVSGVAVNHTGQGCSHFTVHFKLYDHNDALVGDQQDLDIGDVAAGRRRSWTQTMTTLGVIPYEVPDNVTGDSVWATCEDRQ